MPMGSPRSWLCPACSIPGPEGSDMRPVLVDKIASVAVQADLGQEIRVSPDIPCEEGVLIAVEVLNNKSRYNTIELTSGRMAEVKKGDVVVGALGHRKALFGYSGHLPTDLKPGGIVRSEAYREGKESV